MTYKNIPEPASMRMKFHVMVLTQELNMNRTQNKHGAMRAETRWRLEDGLNVNSLSPLFSHIYYPALILQLSNRKYLR